jgi:hypothetical protein
MPECFDQQVKHYQCIQSSSTLTTELQSESITHLKDRCQSLLQALPQLQDDAEPDSMRDAILVAHK